MELLAYCDDPNGATGFSRQAKNILTRFSKQGFEIAAIGINRIDESPLRPFEDDRVSFKVFRAGIDPSDPLGKNLLVKVFERHSADVLFVMGDIWSFRGWFAPWLERCQFRHRFKTIGYFSCEYPMDTEDLDILSLVDYPVCHSKWGLDFNNGSGFDEIKKKIPHLIYIPDTVDSKIFHWSSEDQRIMDRKALGIAEDQYVICNVNRNTVRKDLSSTLSAFRRVKKEIPNARLYLHTAAIDKHLPGGEAINLFRKCELEGLTYGNSFDRDVVFPLNFTPHYGYPEDLLRRIYSCSDLFISTSLSEGFGVTPVEALFCGRPVLIPGHTGFSNICETVGISPVRAYPEKNERVAPSPVYKIEEDHLVNRIMEAYDNRDKPSFRSTVMEQSRKAVEAFDSDRVFEKDWLPLIKGISTPEPKEKAFLYVQRGSAGDVFLSTSVFGGLRNRHPGLPFHYMTMKGLYGNIIEGLVDKIIPWAPSKIHDYEIAYMPHEFRVWPGNWGSGDTSLTRIYSEILGVPFNRPLIVVDPIGGLPEKYVVVHSSAGHPYRDYYNFHLALDGSRLPIIQIGGRDDQILGNGNFEFFDVRGKLTYRQSAYLISKAALFVGVDSFAQHVAGAFDVPMVVTFGCGAARVTGALSNGPTRFLEPVYSKVCPIVGPCFGNYANCPRPCGPRHGPDIVRAAIVQLIPDLFLGKKKEIHDVNKNLMELLKNPSRRENVAK